MKLGWFLFFIASPSALAVERIVTLTPEIGEWSALILGHSEAKRTMVGVTEFTDQPELLKSKERVGSYAALNTEKILLLKPDLVIGSTENTRQDQVEKLKRLKLNVVLMPAATFSGFPAWIEKLGSILEKSKTAQELSKEWKLTVDQMRHPVGRGVRVFVEVQHQPLITIGKQSFLSDALSAIGMENVFSSLNGGYPKVSQEAVIQADPHVILIMDQTNDQKLTDASRSEWNRFQKLNAVRNERIRIISGNDFGRFSPRLLNGLKTLESEYVKVDP